MNAYNRRRKRTDRKRTDRPHTSDVYTVNRDVSMTVTNSSNITYIAYRYLPQTLTIQFRGGLEYVYSDVPLAVFDGLWNAESKGRFFAQHIKNNYQYRRTETENV